LLEDPKRRSCAPTHESLAEFGKGVRSIDLETLSFLRVRHDSSSSIEYGEDFGKTQGDHRGQDVRIKTKRKK
jgi:hypothetical protein